MKNLSDLRVADLELFITAAHLKNLGRAALLHHLSQSAASAAIQRVEAAFGQALCAHERRQFRLTREGTLLLERAESWLKALHETVAAEEAPPLRLVTTHAIARIAVPAVLPLDLKLMRPDSAYAAVLRDEADIALVLDNAPWEGVVTTEVGRGCFQLYSRVKDAPVCPVLLPEDQLEVLALQQRWSAAEALVIKARIPSWSLIADICARSSEVGFLPDFLAEDLYPVSWQPAPSAYRVLALYRRPTPSFQMRLDIWLQKWREIFMRVSDSTL